MKAYKKTIFLSVISLLSLGIMTFGFYSEMNKNIKSIQLELEGVQLIKPLLKLMRLTQHNRSLSSEWTKDNKSLMSEIINTTHQQKQIITIIGDQLPDDLLHSPLWKYILFKQQDIALSGFSWEKEKNFEEQGQLITQLLKFTALIGDDYHLSLDNQQDSYYLMRVSVYDMPLALEYLAQVKAYASKILTVKSISDVEKIKIFNLLGQLHNALFVLNNNLEKVTSHQALNSHLMLIANDIKLLSQEMTQPIYDDILSEKFIVSAAHFSNVSAKAMDINYKNINKVLLPALEVKLRDRKIMAQQKLWGIMSLALLLAFIFHYLFYALYGRETFKYAD